MIRLGCQSGPGRGTRGVTGGVVNRATITICTDRVAVRRALPLSEAVAIESVFR